ncbi:MAG: gliding motility-associated C-terminal domain-containing protein [Lentimicrobium sp.]
MNNDFGLAALSSLRSVVDFGFRISDCGLRISCAELPSVGCGLRIADLSFQPSGCAAIDSAYLKNVYMPFYFNVPNAFTPDGDGLNDVFRPVATGDLIRQFSMVIYNRWGQKVFETSDLSIGWDGEDTPAGVYSWVISYSDMVGKVAKLRGEVTLVR